MKVKIITTILISILMLELAIAANNEINTNQIRNRIQTDLSQAIQNRIRTGNYTSETGKQIQIRELIQNRIRLQENNISINCNNCNLTEETIQNRTRFRFKLKNGSNTEIKIMPTTASQQALQRLRLKNCNEALNCTIELKEVGEGSRTRAAYEARAQKTFRVFGLFRAQREVSTQIDAETGEEIETQRPWWSFLASEEE